jgi:hypothetical protein
MIATTDLRALIARHAAMLSPQEHATLTELTTLLDAGATPPDTALFAAQLAERCPNLARLILLITRR